MEPDRDVQPLFDHYNQAAIIALFRAMNRYVRNLPPMPGVFPECASFPVSSAKTQQALQFIDTATGILQSIHLQL